MRIMRGEDSRAGRRAGGQGSAKEGARHTVGMGISNNTYQSVKGFGVRKVISKNIARPWLGGGHVSGAVRGLISQWPGSLRTVPSKAVSLRCGPEKTDRQESAQCRE